MFLKSEFYKQNLFDSVCQIHRVDYVENKNPSNFEKKYHHKYTWSTGFLVRKNEIEYCFVSCLHIFQTPSKHKVHDQILFATFDFHDNSDLIQSNLSQFEKCFPNVKPDRVPPITAFRDIFKAPAIELELDQRFLEIRKNWLMENKTNLTELLDPIFQLQPHCVDVIVLKIKTKPSDLKLPRALQIPCISDKTILISSNYIAYVGYNRKATIDLEGSASNETIKLPNGKTNIGIISELFIHENKSISAGKILKSPSNNNFVMYQASTIEGSSGGPVFDFDGKLIGISFGYYEDVIIEERCKDEIKEIQKRSEDDCDPLYYEIELSDYKR